MALDLFLGWRPFETIFQGESVTMELRPFKRAAMMAVRPFLAKGIPDIKDDMSEEEINQLADRAFDLQELAGKILPGHIQNIHGITVDGQPVTIEQLSEEIVFLPLTLQIITQIASISALKPGEEKNFGGPSGSIEGQAGTGQ